MPVSEKKKVYLFDGHHKKRFKSVLDNRSLAISFWSNKNPTSTVTKKTEKITRIIICKSLLPRHCEEKLVEQILDFLQKYPEDNDLLKILADYTKNDLFEYIGYWGVLVVSALGSFSSCGVFYAVVVIYPLVLHPYLGVFSLCIIATSLTLFILNMFYDNALGLKFGRWLGDLTKGAHQKSVNLEELKRALMIDIQGGGIEDTEAICPIIIDLEELKRKIMARIRDYAMGEMLEEAVEALISEKNDIKSADDTQSITIDLEELKIKLMEYMTSDEVEKAIKATEEAIEEFSNEDRRVTQEADPLACQHFWVTGSTKQDTVTHTFRLPGNY